MDINVIIAVLVFIIIFEALWIARGYKALDKWLPSYFKCDDSSPAPAPAPAPTKSTMYGGCGGQASFGV